MRRLLIFFILPLTLCVCGCQKHDPYVDYVSELRQDIYKGTAKDLTITAFYGFKESPYVNDGIVGERVYGFTFKLNVASDEVKRTVKFSCGGKDFSADFSVDHVTGEYKAFAEAKKDFGGNFSVNYVCGSEITPVTMVSVIPENCITFERALSVLQSEQRQMLNMYTQNDAFNAEIYMRILMRNDKPYWYVGLASGNGNLKALLIDGITGEILAVREIL